MIDIRPFGNLDVYLFDQLLRGRLRPGSRVLDAGCGSGRHLPVLHAHGCDWQAVDRDKSALAEAAQTVAAVGGDPSDRLHLADLTSLPFHSRYFAFVICCAVLHFAESDEVLERSVAEMLRVIQPGGYLFVRTASTMGLESVVGPRRSTPVVIPDGTERLLVDAAYLRDLGTRLKTWPADPIKSTIVDGARSMATWTVVQPG